MYVSSLLVALLTAAAPASGDGLPDTSKMNVLFIDVEDCNAAVWVCYGNPICRTHRPPRTNQPTGDASCEQD